MDTSMKKINKHLIFTSTDKNKEVLIKYTEHCDKIKSDLNKR